MIRILFVVSVLFVSSAVPLLGQVNLTDRKLSLELESVPLVAVLNMIAQQNNLNLIISGEVEGEVSLKLDNIDVATALDAILMANDYTYFFRGDVIVVKPVASTKTEELETRTITLKYLDPSTAHKAVSTRLSEKGQVIVLDKQVAGAGPSDGYAANRILITDYPGIIDGLVDLVMKLDIPERSILIEARIIETKIDNQLRLGFNWPSAVSAKLGDLEGSTTNTGSVASVSDKYAGTYDIESGRWMWGKLSVAELSAVLDLLDQQGNSHLLSDPRITTIENHQAQFEFQTVIPIQTINRFSEGSATSDIVTFEDEKVGISLVVTPRINEGNTITLDVEPTVEDIIGFNGPPDNQKPITASRSIKTRITVKDGETVALGGLLKEDEIITVKKLPVLGSIPLLGSLLFSHKSVEKTTTDLVIMITPHILD
jgi:type IV pilus assembly protein PilQ